MPTASSLKRGDVALVLFPHSNLTTASLRPALVVQAEGLQTGIDQVVVAMITSRMFRAGHPSRVSILRASPVFRQSGLLMDSVVMTDNLATVFLTGVDRVVGSLPMAEVEKALRHTFGL
jgi:mRNA interferase MazF